MEKISKILKHPLTWIIFLGFSFRFYGVKNFPVLHDELMSILDGVNKTKESLLHFFFIAPMENSLGIMPLYFWVERFFTDIFGQNNWGLRLFPLISGVLTIALAYWVIKKQFNKNLAILSSFIVAFSDIFLWTTSKAQFFEVILVPLSFLVFYFLTSENKKKFYFASLLLALMLFTYFGKGLVWIACSLVWYTLVKIFDFVRLKTKWPEVILTTKKELLQFSSFFWIPLIWIIAAQILVFSKGPIQNAVGLGEIDSVWKILFITTFGYGFLTKQFLAGSPKGAFLVFDNLHAWPVTGLLFIPFLFGLGILIYRTILDWKKINTPLFKRDSFLLIFALIPLLYIISKGIISVRFHLLYFLPFVIITSIGLSKAFSLFEKRKILFFGFILSLGIYGAYISSWENWYYSVFNWDFFYKLSATIITLIILYFMIGVFTKIDKKIFLTSSLGIFLFFLIIINLFHGPLIWGKKAAWEPAYDNKLAPAPEYYIEGNEESVINFAFEKNNPDICYKLPEKWKNTCLERFGLIK